MKINEMKLSKRFLQSRKEAFIKNGRLGFKEIVVLKDQLSGKRSACNLRVREADLRKAAKLIKIFGMLLQVNAYRFGSKEKCEQTWNLELIMEMTQKKTSLL